MLPAAVVFVDLGAEVVAASEGSVVVAGGASVVVVVGVSDFTGLVTGSNSVALGSTLYTRKLLIGTAMSSYFGFVM